MGLKEDYEAGATYLIGENIKKYEENHEVLNRNTNFKIKKMKAGRLLFSVVPLACSFMAFAFSLILIILPLRNLPYRFLVTSLIFQLDFM